jgi:hypothetical protein
MPSTNSPESRLKWGASLMARAGYVAKGVVYLLVGGFASLAAFGLGGRNLGSKEAIAELLNKPFGDVMLGLLGIGLLAYALWRLLQALLDTEGVGLGLKGAATRLAFLASGAVHTSLAVYCFDLLRNLAMASGDAEVQDRTALLMSHPGGVALVFAAGLVLQGIGLRQLWRAARRSYLKNWHREQMTRSQRRLFEGVARWGLAARGVVFVIIGLFLCLAAWQADPRQAQGLGGALSWLATQAFGPWLLGGVALGLIGYGLYCLINAGFRDTRID